MNKQKLENRDKPIIGIVPLVDLQRESYWMLPGYMKGIELAGGFPVMFPLTSEDEDILQMIRLCDGILFTGGQDVEPQVYGEEKTEACGECRPERDRMEIMLFKELLKDDKPVLGICRGIQLFNACLGGTLYQDLPSQHASQVCHRQFPPYDEPVHEVILQKHTPLQELLEKSVMQVNSYHHQAVDRVADGMIVSAAAPDGIIEAIERPASRFMLGVQWHPETSYFKDIFSRRIFEAFMNACREK